ncbi:MAG TPA: hypothetical protein VGD01_12815 [Candidatus Elarobacter sp.]
MRVPIHSLASIRTAIGRSGAAALAVAALTFSMTSIGQAQTAPADETTTTASAPILAPAGQAPLDQASPNPAASPAGQSNPRSGAPNAPQPGSAQSPSGGPSATRATPAPARPLGHWPIIDFVVTFTQPAYYTNMTQLPAYDPIDLGGTVRIPITRKLNLLFDRITEGTINQPLERSAVFATANNNGTCITLPCAFTLPKDTRDIILQYHATYAFDRFVTMDVGNSFRHRVFSSGSGTNFALLTNISAQPFPYTLSSTEHHFSYLTVSYTTKPWKNFWNSQFVFSESGDVQNVDHHVAILCTAAMIAGNLNQCGGRLVNQVGYLDERPGTDKFYETTQGVTWILPVDPRHGTTFTLNERWGYLNFYENTPYPWRWASALTYQLNKRFSPGFTLAMRHSDFHEATGSGAPFAPPNVIHVGSWDLIGTFHLDTNTWFH